MGHNYDSILKKTGGRSWVVELSTPWAGCLCKKMLRTQPFMWRSF